MTVVSAFLVPGSPLPLLRSDVLPWGRLASGFERAGRALAASAPDALLIYSTQWIAVLDQLWQTRPALSGKHVDENWYEHGELDYSMTIDTELTYACLAASPRIGISSKPVNYDGFPIDTGSIVATRFLLGGKEIPVVLASNNLYHSNEQTEQLGAMAVQCAQELGKRVSVIGVGGLSGSIFRQEIELRADKIFSESDDQWNRRMLDLMERGDMAEAATQTPNFASEARADMGFKHFSWILGGTGRRCYGARVHAYGPTYGAGAAVVEFKL